MPTASARHILVAKEETCQKLKEEIEAGKDFGEVAQKYSLCPSGRDGGNLGTFNQGDMVPEFDAVVFNDDVGVVHGPIKTQFGYHLLEVLERND